MSNNSVRCPNCGEEIMVNSKLLEQIKFAQSYVNKLETNIKALKERLNEKRRDPSRS